MQIHVGVFDEHAIFRHGVVVSLSGDPLIEVAVEAPVASRPVLDGRRLDVAVTSATAAPPGLLDCPTVVCAGPGGLPQATAQDAGAVLPRHTVLPEQLTSAVRAAAVGLRIAESGWSRCPMDDRTLRVLALLAEGADTREIAVALGWSERTIKGVIAAAEQQLGARTRAQAVATAIRDALI